MGVVGKTFKSNLLPFERESQIKEFQKRHFSLVLVKKVPKLLKTFK